jgi:hypothetical protein
VLGSDSGPLSVQARDADRAAVLVVDGLNVAVVLEHEFAAVGGDDGVALVQAAGAVAELGDDAAAVAVEHPLLGQRAVGPVGVGVRMPTLLAAAIENGLAPLRGRAGAGHGGPLPALMVAGGHARLVRVVCVPRGTAERRHAGAAHCAVAIRRAGSSSSGVSRM